jgi:hypothetical protein
VVENLLVRSVLPWSAGKFALVPDGQLQARDEEGGLAGTGRQFVVGELGVRGEDLPVGPVPDPGAGDPPLCLADHVQHGVVDERFERGSRIRAGSVLEAPWLSPAERHLVRLAAAVHLGIKPGGEGVDHGSADAVQAARCGVGSAAELASGVQLCEDHFHAGEAGLGFDVDRDAAAVVVDLHRVVRVQDDLDVMAEAGKRLINRVVNDFPKAVHEAPGVRGTDVHARTLSDSLEAFQHRKVAGGVIRTRCHR